MFVLQKCSSCTQYNKDTEVLQSHFDKVGSLGKVPITMASGYTCYEKELLQIQGIQVNPTS